MKYFVCSGYYILNAAGRFYVVDETSDCSFVLKRKDKICLCGQTFSPRFESGKRYFEAMVCHPLDGFIGRDIISALGGVELDKGAVVIGQQPLAA